MSDHPVLYRAYGVVSNIKAPPHAINSAKEIADFLSDKNFVLRTGGGNTDIENLFEASTPHKELYLPWKNFNEKDSKIVRYSDHIREIAQWQQPSYESLVPFKQSFINRNIAVVLGKEGTSPLRFLICWSQDGIEHPAHRTSATGFIGICITVAGLIKVPIFNLHNTDVVHRVRSYIEGLDR